MISTVYLVMCRNKDSSNTKWDLDINAFLDKSNAQSALDSMKKLNPKLKFTLETVSIIDR